MLNGAIGISSLLFLYRALNRVDLREFSGFEEFLEDSDCVVPKAI
jgi:hypothetical protein